ncbi:flavin-dependent oxidoreductase [Zeimonas arvi]|uniref:Flavin-dependent oxidoreductase n=1 Tax=Zeimonas arvi TaxID=2498847 RepID=A0A5C8NU46_9BURK|nr:flavin-dependent oxidoreductase [Zeimonas arvi]TXL64681.1 flavin-dependent oxidoreductase [Zeimonas arvi]
MKVLIIGGGIGGLTLALMLHARGIRPRIVEAAVEVKPLGVGINVQPSAVAELTILGLLERLDATGVRTAEVGYYNKLGQHIWSEPRGVDAGYAVPQFSIHRGRLQMLLFDAVRERLGADAIETGLEAVAVEPDAGCVTLRSRADGATRTEQADAIVAADGIHSAVRRQFYPDEGLPRYSGRILWRATSYDRPWLTGRTMVMAGYADQKLVAYPITRPDAEGRALLNWIAELRVPGGTPPKDDWNREVPRSVFAPAFADWKFPWLDVPKLFEGAERVFEFPMVDRDPLPRWSFGRVTLLGDAAHPMYPIGSNGASQAILDARVLADALEKAGAAGDSASAAGQGAIEGALKAYEADRLPRTARIVMANRGQGPDHVMQIVEERAPNGFGDVHEVASHEELVAIAAQYKAIVGLEIETVNAKMKAWEARGGHR